MLSQSQIRSYWAPRCSGPFATVSLYGAGKVTVDSAIVPAVKALNQVLTAYKYYTRSADTGAYVCRLNTSGTAWSNHAYGTALDINWLTNPYYKYLRSDMDNAGDGRMPHRICAIRTNNGRQIWNWGGFWFGVKDSMHYEIVCSPSDLRTGINQSTVYSYSGNTPVRPPVLPILEEDDMPKIIYATGRATVLADPTTGTWKPFYNNDEVNLAIKVFEYEKKGVSAAQWDELKKITTR